MSHPIHDLDSIEAMVAALPQLIEGEHLFREVVVERADGVDKVTLTLEGLLDALDAAAHHGTNEARLRSARAGVAAVREASRAAYGATLQRELRSALNDWRAVAGDLADESDDVADAWAYATQNRSRAARLLAEAEAHGLDDGGAGAALASLDARIRRSVDAAAFQGPPSERARYPRETWWWLWSAPRD